MVEVKDQENQHKSGLEYKISLLKGQREKRNSRLERKFNAVEHLLKNKVAVEEEMLQINDLIKLLMSLHAECNDLL